jgi:hypothetical protein
METWTTVIVAFIVAASTLGATFLQNWYSSKRLKIELGRAIAVEDKKRKWDVRSVPLLKLREELANMAVKQDKLVAAASRKHTRMGGTADEARKELREAIDDWNIYLSSGGLAYTIFIQYESDLIRKVEEIRTDYQRSYFYHLYYQQMDEEKLSEAMKVFENNKNKIIEVQEIINKRLEEL